MFGLGPWSRDGGQHLLTLASIVSQVLQARVSAVQQLYVTVDDIKDLEVLKATPGEIADEAWVAKQAATYAARVCSPALYPLEFRWRLITRS